MAQIERLIHRHTDLSAAAFGPLFAARVIYQNVAHDLRGQSKEVRLVLPVNRILSGQLQIGFVHERGGLQGMLRAFGLKLPGCYPPQIVINQRHQLPERLCLSLAVLIEQQADLR
jgi:hypothetical protein